MMTLEECKLNAIDLKKLFDEVNEDISNSDDDAEFFIPLSDIEYYSEQIQNLYQLSEKEAKTLAKQMSEL
jgi:hypothetical protein